MNETSTEKPRQTDKQPASSARDDVLQLKARMGQSIVGQEKMIERLLLGLIANGNLLVEGLPGLAKTRAIKSLAKNLDADLSRIQFTPDLLPSDITGSEVYFSEGGKGEFKFQQGPIFANLVLADEVNRAPAKVQSAASWPSFAAAGPAVPDAGASSARTMRTMAASDFSSE